MTRQHWIDRAAYWRERAEKAEAELQELRRREGEGPSGEDVVVFYAVVADVSDGGVHLAVADDFKEYPSVGARVEVRVRWSPSQS